MMEVVVTTGAINHGKLQSNRHHQQTNIQFFTGRMPFLSPNQQCQNTEGKYGYGLHMDRTLRARLNPFQNRILFNNKKLTIN